MIQEDIPKIVKLAKSIENDASICVKCGLCLEHCPTYLRTHDENESPRGRIALLQAVANEQIPINASLQSHIDHCLTCRACESACPAYVPYGNLIDAGRTYMHEKHIDKNDSLMVQLMRWLVAKPKRLATLHKLLWWSQISGLRPLMQFLRIPNAFGLSNFDRLLGKIHAPKVFKPYYPTASRHPQGTVALFVGCMHSWIDQKTAFDAIKVLTRIGFHVHIPQKQNCCGAMSRHDGRLPDAISFAEKNLTAFELDDCEHICFLPSGCGAELKNYQLLLGRSKHQTQAKAFCEKVIDIISLIHKTNYNDQLKFMGFKKRKTVFVHTPCTMKHHMRMSDPAITLLGKIPNLNVVPFQSQTCCGAAGSHMIKHPDTALEFLSPYFYELNDLAADFIASSNIGCALHFRQGVKHFGKKAAIVHPVSLLAASLYGKKNG